MAGYSLPNAESVGRLAVQPVQRPAKWETRYLWKTFTADICCGLAAGLPNRSLRLMASALTDAADRPGRLTAPPRPAFRSGGQQ